MGDRLGAQLRIFKAFKVLVHINGLMVILRSLVEKPTSASKRNDFVPMQKSTDWPLVLTVLRSSSFNGRSLVRSPLEKGRGGNVRFIIFHYCRHILGLDNQFGTEK